MTGSSRRNKREAAILLSLCLILGFVLFQHFSSGSIGSTDVRAAIAPPASETTVPVEPAPAIPSLDMLDETVLRPLFLPSRRPVDPVEKPPPAAEPKAQRARLILMGVIIFEDRRLALIKKSRTGVVVRVSEGQRVDRWRVERIVPDRVVLTENGVRRELRLKDALLSVAGRGEEPRRQPRKKKKQALSLSQEVVDDETGEQPSGSGESDEP